MHVVIVQVIHALERNVTKGGQISASRARTIIAYYLWIETTVSDTEIKILETNLEALSRAWFRNEPKPILVRLKFSLLFAKVSYGFFKNINRIFEVE